MNLIDPERLVSVPIAGVILIGQEAWFNSGGVPYYVVEGCNVQIHRFTFKVLVE